MMLETTPTNSSPQESGWQPIEISERHPAILQMQQATAGVCGLPWLRPVLVGFDVDSYSTELPTRYGIDEPVSIRASVIKRRAEFFFGRLAAKLALRSWGLGEVVVTIGAAREPCWPVGFRGSISHHGQLAAAVVVPASSCSGAGIDVEPVLDGEHLPVVMGSVVDAAELQILQALAPALELPLALTLAFSAKESFYKAAYSEVGRFFDFSAAAVTGIDPIHGTVRLAVRESLCARFPPGTVVIAHYLKLLNDAVLTVVYY
ncbi:MAG: 4'-phosphopantetheinyl transferase superfamily protein [Rhodanobacter sp.]|nr:4'-phosphopantetheinyl transferase superfamily protein [Rhodanobacter sp.]